MSNLYHPHSNSRVRLTIAMVAVSALWAFVAIPAATAQTYSVLYSFGGVAKDGVSPEGKLAVDSDGNLYGTTYFGGSGSCIYNGSCGTIFKLDSTGTETILHNFAGSDGDAPTGGVIRDRDGNLYGMTSHGGDLTQNNNFGCGTIFKLDPSGTLTTLHAFESGADGCIPAGGLISFHGELYGATYGENSSHDRGTIFKASKNGAYRVIYRFRGGIDGQEPMGLTADSAGNLYGVTSFGGDRNGEGLIFKLDTSYHLTVLFLLPGAAGGSEPQGRILRDVNGNFHGTTATGGQPKCQRYGNGCGVAYRVSNTGVESVLHTFGNTVTDGDRPNSSLVDAGGVLYGATPGGGDLCGNGGCGTLYRIGKDGAYSQVHIFPAFAGDAIAPGELTLDSAGNLYGVSQAGGQFSSGTVFRFTP